MTTTDDDNRHLHQRSDNPSQIRPPFPAFVEVAISTIIAIVFAWRYLLFSSNRNENGTAVEPTSNHSELQQSVTMEPLMALLPTDTLPESVAFEGVQPLLPSSAPNISTALLLHESSDHQLPLYVPVLQHLHSIPEEVSDDELSHSSSRATTVIHAEYSDSTRLSTPILDSTQKQDTEEVDQELVKDFQTLDCSRSFFRDLAEVLRSIDSDTDSGSIQSSASIADERKNLEKTEKFAQKSMAYLKSDEHNDPLTDYGAAANNAEESFSLKSASISFDQSRDSVLDASLCSNPIDEAAIMESTLKARSANSDDFNGQIDNRDTVRSSLGKDQTATTASNAVLIQRPKLTSLSTTTAKPNLILSKTSELSESVPSQPSVLPTSSEPLSLPPPPPLLPPPPLSHLHRSSLSEIRRAIEATKKFIPKTDKTVPEQLQQRYCDSVAETTASVSNNDYSTDNNSNGKTSPFIHHQQEQSYMPSNHVSSISNNNSPYITTNTISDRNKANEYIATKVPSQENNWNLHTTLSPPPLPPPPPPPLLPSSFRTTVLPPPFNASSSSSELLSHLFPKNQMISASKPADMLTTTSAISPGLLPSASSNKLTQQAYDFGDGNEPLIEQTHFEPLYNSDLRNSITQQAAAANTSSIDISKTSLSSPLLPQISQLQMSTRSPAYPYSSSKIYRNLSEQRSSDMSRDDLDGQRSEMRSRSTVREIPVRTVSAIGPGNTTAVEYRSGVTPWGDNFQEYYRKEVMTRTYVTRSTEALSVPPLSRSSPVTISHERYPSNERHYPREEHTVDYNYKYTKNLEDEERRIKEDQERRRMEEEERRRRAEEERTLWEIREKEIIENMRKEREKRHRELESERLERERQEFERIEQDRLAREDAEMKRRKEWERLENERRVLEERELEKKRQLERDRLEKQRLEEERIERERLERERMEREKERLERERQENERLERERIERERIEMERLEIERIERIKRERLEKERIEWEKEREEAERKEKERLEKERIALEKRELLRMEQELREAQRREAEMRENERLAEEKREAQRREQERRDAQLLAEIQRKAEEKEAQRRLTERQEKERLDALRREQERIEKERQEIERRERQRLEDERREKELLEAQRRAAERREKERQEDERRERERQEEERREAERRERERREQQMRERERQLEEQMEREKLATLEKAAIERRAAREAERQLEEKRELLERKAQELRERERLEAERRDRERFEEERTLSELRERERKNAEMRERERLEALAREAARRRDDRRSRDKLDQIAREIEEKEKMEAEKRRLLEEMEERDRRRQMLTSHETLEKLTKAPYYVRDNLSLQPYDARDSSSEVMTKVERQVFERVDRTFWSDDPRHQKPSVSSDSPDADLALAKERIYQRRLNEDDDFIRGSSRRSSKYRSKMEKARKEFLFTDASPTSDPLNDRFRMSIDEPLLRSSNERRSTQSQKYSDFGTKTDFRSIPYSNVGPGAYDKEYRQLFEKVDKAWAAYRKRLSHPNLYSRSLACSTSYLETNLDTGIRDIASIKRQVEETNLDDVHRSGSVMDYTRQSRRDRTDSGEPASHVRSKSADYLMDRKMREESAPPENELQKFGEKTPNISEHELRFRKSTEKLQVPDWYREKRVGRTYDLDTSLSTTTSERIPYAMDTDSYSSRYHNSSGHNEPVQRRSLDQADSVQLPSGMFDRYKDEIEELRRSRTSLHQLSTDRKEANEPENTKAQQITSFERVTMQQQSTIRAPEKQLPGYTVTTVPVEWNLARDRNSRVVEVADTFIGMKNASSGVRYGGRVTLEEVLDSIFHETKPSAADSDFSSFQTQTEDAFLDGPGIYTKNLSLMRQVSNDPAKAEKLLRNERLYIRCARCHQTRELSAARAHYVSCKHCYTYYCSKLCRELDWPKHFEWCSFARINTLCKDVIMKVRSDREAQWFMSKIARDGYAARGRGSVSLRLTSPQLGEQYVKYGWPTLAHIDIDQLLFYYTVDDLVDERKEPSLIALCRKYDPTDKFILSVSIIADMGKCPETPPPEVATTEVLPAVAGAQQQQTIGNPSVTAPPTVSDNTAAPLTTVTSGAVINSTNNLGAYNTATVTAGTSPLYQPRQQSQQQQLLPYNTSQISSSPKFTVASATAAVFQSPQDEFRTAVPTEV